MTELLREAGPCEHVYTDWGYCIECNKHESDDDWLDWAAMMDAEKEGGHRAVEAYLRTTINGEARDNIVVYDHKMKWQWAENNAMCVLGLEDTSYDVDFETIWDWPFLLRNDYNYNGTLMTELTPTAKKWLRWLATDSLWAPAFITKRAHDMLTKGVLYDCRTVPTRVLITAMAAVRYVGESPYIPELWNRWLPICENPHEAVYLAHTSEFNEKGQVTTRLVNQGHSMFDVTDTLFGRYEFNRLCKGEYIQAPPIQEAHGWPDLCRQFGIRVPTPKMNWPSSHIWTDPTDWLGKLRKDNPCPR